MVLFWRDVFEAVGFVDLFLFSNFVSEPRFEVSWDPSVSDEKVSVCHPCLSRKMSTK